MEPDGDSYYDPQLGMTITWSGRAYWRERLREARERHRPEDWAALRAQLGLPDRPPRVLEVTKGGVTYRLARPQ